MTMILIVEDSPTQAHRLALILQGSGFEVQIRSDGVSAFEMLQAQKFDLILSDIVMPGMTGYEFCSRVKAEEATKDLPVILLSGLSDPMEIIHAIECGADSFVAKPYQEDVLLKRIQDVLMRYELRKKNTTQSNEIYFMGSTFNLVTDPRRALELLVSSFEDTVRTNKALKENRLALQREHTLLIEEQDRSESLLQNVLPKEIAARLKNSEEVIADKFSDVSILFADIAGFTAMASEYSAQDLVSILNTIFSKFDKMVEQFGLEKIKTIGDAYMVAGGLPVPNPDHLKSLADLAIEMQDQLAQFSVESGKSFSMRIGVNTGPAVAGVIGRKKFLYDLWGDTVNTASRMESQGIPGSIQVTEDVFNMLKDDYILEKRGEIEVKGKGMMTTYFLRGKR